MKFNIRNFAISTSVAATAMFIISRLIHMVMYYSGMYSMGRLGGGRMMMFKDKVATCGWGMFLMSWVIGILSIFVISFIGGWLFAWFYNYLAGRK